MMWWLKLLNFLKYRILQIIDFWLAVPQVLIIFLIFPLVEKDKEQHRLFGLIGTLLLTILLEIKINLLTAGLIAGGIAMIIAISKEIIWDLILKKGNFELADIIVTFVGGAVAWMWLAIISVVRGYIK